ncbi:MAG: hypothetical protein ACU841_17940 [Gammaproteobacteria bacterium]
MKNINYSYPLLFFYLWTLNAPAHAMASDPLEDNDGSLSSEKPHIPEPMVFDLVRPLGVDKGELEINSLVQYSRHGEFEWAPEIEFAPWNDFALELELPFDNTRLQEYKIAAQGTFGVFRRQFIHGWQAIGRYDRNSKTYAGDLLYLNGYSSKNQWSVFNMAGIRLADDDRSVRAVGLLNNSFFYALSERFSAGIELNNEFNNHKRWRYLITPQLHIDMDRNMSVQLGAGYSSLNHHGKEWLGIWRVIYAF